MNTQIDQSTPMMQQYYQLKAQHKDCLLLFRLGDFYELFFEDAKTAAAILEIVLTKRGKTDAQDIPMCGIPYHSVDIYIQKLVKAGHKVAICEQLESPEEAKKRGYKAVVKREIVRIITPGTLTEERLLDSKKANYLASLVVVNQDIAIAYADLSTLEFNIISSDLNTLLNDLNSINPSELIISDDILMHKGLMAMLADFKSRLVTFVDSFFDIKKTTKKLQDNFGLYTLDSLGSFSNSQVSACGSLIEYLYITQKKETIILGFPKIFRQQQHMIIDKVTQTNLELFESKGERGQSLLDVIDATLTSAGARMLRKFLLFPAINIKTINNRLDLVEWFVNNAETRSSIRTNLKGLADLERTIAKLAVNRGSSRELYNIQQALRGAHSIVQCLSCHSRGSGNPAIQESTGSRIKADLDLPQGLGRSASVRDDNAGGDIFTRYTSKLSATEPILKLLDSALIDRGLYLNEEDFIHPNYNPQLEEYYNFRDNSKLLLENLRKEYVNKTGIQNLKLEFNNVLGYYIEVTKLQSSKITSEEFIHRQSTLNSVRFVTTKLKEVENKILGVKEQIEALEKQIFQEIANQIIKHHKLLLDAAQIVAFIDVVASLAFIAAGHNFCRPELNTTKDLIIENGRHPVVERSLESSNNTKFIENSCKLTDHQKIWLITGPNMAGKSTFLRQNALITILAHIGSFVPATKAVIGLVDRVFSRIGAGDDLAKGHSTFLVEMIETATILNQATDNSLIILDEIGRGTSTYDGVAIAWSCLEYIHDNICGRTLFSTHYHELTELSNLQHLKCYTISVKEWENKVIFMHKVVEGVASRSYGINVAEIAGIPKEVITRSREILNKLHGENCTTFPV